MRPAIIIFQLLAFSFSMHAAVNKADKSYTIFKNHNFLAHNRFFYKSVNTSSDSKSIFFASSNPDKDSISSERLRRKARLANALGIASLAGFFIPFVNFFSIPLAITAIIIGTQAKKQATDLVVKNEASKGVIAGWITLLLVAILGYFIIRLFK